MLGHIVTLFGNYKSHMRSFSTCMPKNVVHIYVETIQLDPIYKNLFIRDVSLQKIYNGDSLSVHS
jgi:hypothetical protein